MGPQKQDPFSSTFYRLQEPVERSFPFCFRGLGRVKFDHPSYLLAAATGVTPEE